MLPVPRIIASRPVILIAAAVLAALGLVYAGTRPAHSASFSKNGVSITVSVTCTTQKTTVTETTRSGGNPGFAARVRGQGGTWYQGPETSGVGSTSTAFLQAPSVPASGHGVRVFWLSGAQNYTFC
jgi:hypothetical protein